MIQGTIQQEIKVIEDSNKDKFEIQVNEYLNSGFQIIKCEMPIMNLGKINEYTKYQAVLVKIADAILM